MLTELKNGVFIRLADVRAIKTEKLSKSHGWEAEWGVKITYGAPFGVPEVETCVFDSDSAAWLYAAEIGKQAREEILAEFNVRIEADRRRHRDRVLDRSAAILAGMVSRPGHVASEEDAARTAIRYESLIQAGFDRLGKMGS